MRRVLFINLLLVLALVAACSFELDEPATRSAPQLPPLDGFPSGDVAVDGVDIPTDNDTDPGEGSTVIDFEDPAIYTTSSPGLVSGGAATLESLTRIPANEVELASAGIYPMDPPDSTSLDPAAPDLRSLWPLDGTTWAGLPNEVQDLVGGQSGSTLALPRWAKWGGGAQLARDQALTFPTTALDAVAPRSMSMWTVQDRTAGAAGVLASKAQVDATADALRSEVFDISVINPRVGFYGGAFDGRYIYFAPREDGNGIHGVVTRYDTQLTFADVAAWSFMDITTIIPTTGFAGAIYDGRYVYFVPNTETSGPHGKIARYDTREAFDLGTSWAFYDIGGIFTGAEGFVGGTFDGRYLYLAPFGSPVHGKMVRYDTTRALNFLTSWEMFDVETRKDIDAKGFAGAVFDGRYVYYAPVGQAGASHGNVVRYDTRGGFDDAASWDVFDTETKGSLIRGYSGAIFDGRYVYFVPFHDGFALHGRLVRYDTTLPFGDDAAWDVRDLGLLQGLVAFVDGAFDGRYLYLVYFGAGISGALVRFDTTQDFQFGAFEVIDMSLRGALGFASAIFDGRYLYMVPFLNVGGAHGQVLRYDAVGQANPLALWSSLGSQGGISSGPIGPMVSIETDAGRFSAASGLPLAAGIWHHIAASFDGTALQLRVDGELVSETATSGAWTDNANPLLVGGAGFTGLLDTVAVWGRALDDADVQERSGRVGDASELTRNHGDVWGDVSASAGVDVATFGGGVALDGKAHIEVQADERFDGAPGATLQVWARREGSQLPVHTELVAARWGSRGPLESEHFDAVDASVPLPAVIGGYAGGVFDGQFAYFAPEQDGNFLRYDTFKATSDATAWATWVLGAQGFFGAAFDGQFVYLIPNGLAGDTTVVRYDVGAPFDDPASYAQFDLAALGERVGSRGAVFDGQYLYLVPGDDDTGPHATVLRYDTSAPLEAVESWLAFDASSAGGYDVSGACGGLFDGRYVYFVPGANALGPHGAVLRYDTQGTFDDPGSWNATALEALDGRARGYCGGAFDGRYLYLAPGDNGTADDDIVARYDTQASFALAEGWAFRDLNAVDGLVAGGYTGAVFDGAFVTFVPGRRGTGEVHGRVVRFDTRRPFQEAAAWHAADASATGGLATIGMRGAVFDGRHIMFAPDFDGSSIHARFLRLDVAEGDAAFVLGSGLGAQSGGLSGGPFGPFAAAATAQGYRFVHGPDVLDDAWHELTLSVGSTETALLIDGVVVASERNFGQQSLPSGPLHIGEGFAGELDDLVLWPAAIDRAALLRHVLDGYPIGRTGAVELTTSLEIAEATEWSGFEAVEDVPVGTDVRYQISTDSGLTWRVWDGFGWQGETSLTLGSSAEDVNANIGLLPAAQGRINVRVLLETDDGAATPAVDEVVVRYLTAP